MNPNNKKLKTDSNHNSELNSRSENNQLFNNSVLFDNAIKEFSTASKNKFRKLLKSNNESEFKEFYY